MQAEQDKHSGRVIVTGANSPIGHFLLPHLADAGFEVMAISRKPPASRSTKNHALVHWHQIGSSLAVCEPPLARAGTIIHVAPLWLLPAWLKDFTDFDGRRIIAFGSTSRFSKHTSSAIKERNIAGALAAAEAEVASMCERSQIRWTVFRPTLVYGAGLDRNVSTIVSFIRRWGFFPIVGKGNGLRQPVHAEDLAAACVSAMTCPTTFNRAYNLVGGETLSYREMVQAVFLALGKRPRLISVPQVLFKLGIQVFACFPKYHYLTTEMVTRMNIDLCFDSSKAYQDFGYAPREFRKALPRELAQKGFSKSGSAQLS